MMKEIMIGVLNSDVNKFFEELLCNIKACFLEILDYLKEYCRSKCIQFNDENYFYHFTQIISIEKTYFDLKTILFYTKKYDKIKKKIIKRIRNRISSDEFNDEHNKIVTEDIEKLNGHIFDVSTNKYVYPIKNKILTNQKENYYEWMLPTIYNKDDDIQSDQLNKHTNKHNGKVYNRFINRCFKRKLYHHEHEKNEPFDNMTHKQIKLDSVSTDMNSKKYYLLKNETSPLERHNKDKDTITSSNISFLKNTPSEYMLHKEHVINRVTKNDDMQDD
ncbi:hypothetical protein PFTANZ_05982, partial [Plasmodium falciparum Tanzania (2000708)]